MTHQHTIRVTEQLEALGVALADFTADVTVNLLPGSGDGWNEPREPACAEFASVVQIEGPHIRAVEFVEWAECWVVYNQARIWSDVRASEPF